MTSLTFSMVAMSFLNRSEEARMPSCPPSDTTTGAVLPLCGVTPQILATQVLLLTSAPRTPLPIQITLFAVVTPLPANEPNATLLLPVAVVKPAPYPQAMLV